MMRFTLIIDGDSIDELFPVGVKDLMNHFLPKYLNIKKEDILECSFVELTEKEQNKMMAGEQYTTKISKDNYYRENYEPY